jgi:hypothetical protein
MAMRARDAWLMSLATDGPGEVSTVCAAAFGAGVELIDLAGVRAAVAAGRGAELLALFPIPDGYAGDRVVDGLADIALGFAAGPLQSES